MTFAQMKQRIETAMAKVKEQQAKQPQQPAPADAQNVDLKFNVKVPRLTRANKDRYVGLTASRRSIMTMTMDATDQKSGQTGSLAITNDMYLVPEVPGYDEVRDFYKRYALKMGSVINDAISLANHGHDAAAWSRQRHGRHGSPRCPNSKAPLSSRSCAWAPLPTALPPCRL